MKFSIDVANKIATPVNPPEIVCGNSDYVIEFTFDEEWREYGIKTAIFNYKRNGQKRFIEIVFEGNECPMPILSGIDEVNVGVYAGELQTTTPATLICKKSVLCDITKHEDPPYDVYSQFLQIVNNTYTVAAVTELKNDMSDLKEATEAAVNKLREDTDNSFTELEKTVPPHAQIIVTVRGGSVSCKNESGELIQGTQDGNVWTFTAAEYGNYTIKGTYGTLEQEKVISVTSVEQYFETLEFYYDNFADNDWQTIVDVIQRGVAPETWNVGDTKTVTPIDNNYTIADFNVVIIGKNHDTYESGEVAPFTFLALGANQKYQMNGTNTNVGGWASSGMRTNLIPNIFVATLPEPISNALKAVKKYTSAGNTSSVIEVTSDRAFLLSEVEILGTQVYSFEGEGSQYEYFRNGNTISNSEWWLRSPYYSDATSFLTRVYQNTSYLGAYNQVFMLPAFCF